MKERLEDLAERAHAAGFSYTDFSKAAKRAFIAVALRRNNGNQSRTARDVGMHRNTLFRTIVELELVPLLDEFRKAA
jgi:DNA-binding NtrC family response regulator